ncbi:MAG: DUF429 domain-containing protein [bacterium]|nr:DUF429 domain-containing protein [bacterium]
MKTLGIDLSSDPSKTGGCVVEWSVGEALVLELQVGLVDDALLELHSRSDVTGIDSPFGWPEPFTEFVKRQRDQPTEYLPDWTNERRDQLRFRTTDFKVKEVIGRWPLSVSSDLIALPTMRCVGLLARMGVEDRSGNGRVFETYPAAALKQWGLRSTGYKKPKNVEVLRSLFSDLCERAPWLKIPAPEHRDLLSTNDDAFDALIAAMITRAAVLGLVVQPTTEEKARARTEGWIAIPDEGSFIHLTD